MTYRKLPHLDDVLRELNYDSETGVFTNRIKRNAAAPLGAISGAVLRKGKGQAYRTISFNKHRIPAQRLAWLIVYGQDPGQLVIDHINGDGLDNRICNLRAVTHQQNLFNSRLSIKNKSGHRGVYWGGYTWVAYIRAEGKMRYLGSSKVFEEAVAIYQLAANKFRGEFAINDFNSGHKELCHVL